MKLIELTIDGLFSYYDKSVVTLDQRGIILIEGEVDDNADESNGAGKSSIVDAICLCLFKKTTRGTENNEVVNDDRDEGYAELIFETPSGLYQAVYQRSKKRDKTTWTIYQADTEKDEWVAVSGKGLTETREIIQSIIGMDFNTFSNSVLFAQNGVSVFIEGTDKTRKDLLTQILGLDVLDGALKATRGQLGTLNDQLHTEMGRREAFQDQVSKEDSVRRTLRDLEGDVTESKTAILQLEEAIAKCDIVEQYLVALRDLDSKIDDLQRQQNQLCANNNENRRDYDRASSRLTDDLEAHKVKLERIDEVSHEIVRLKDEIVELEAKREAHYAYQREDAVRADELERLQTEIDKHRQAIDDMDTDLANCPYCGSELTPEGVQQLVDKHKQDVKDAVDKALDIQKARVATADTLSNLAAVSVLSTAQTKLAQLEALFDQRTETVLKIGQLTEEIGVLNIEWGVRKTKFDKEFAGFTKQIDETTDKKRGVEQTLIDKGTDLDRTRDEYEDDLKDEQSRLDKLNRQYGNSERELEEISRAKDQLTEVEAKMDSLKTDIVHEQFLEHMFGADGVKAKIIQGITPRLTDLGNGYLSDLWGESTQIEFVTSYQGDKKIVDDFKILVTRKTKTKDIRSFSGGERKKLEFAVRFPISDIVREKAACNAEFLILDEPFDGLDWQSTHKVVQLLRKLSSRFSTIIVMCHQAKAKELFDRTITVRKNGDRSQIVE